MIRPMLCLAGIALSMPVHADSNPMQPGTWEFTRSGGMAANRIGRFCVTAADIADPMSPVNGFLSRDEKARCVNWNIKWHADRAQYSGACQVDGRAARIAGRIVAAADTYSDIQTAEKEGETAVSPILDIINGLRLGPCAN